MAVQPPLILLTGATGFLGKVILEELMRLQERGDLPEHRVVILLRPSKNLCPKARFAKLANSRCFSYLKEDWKERVEVVSGELMSRYCGLDPNDYTMICNSVTHIIHSASSTNFDMPLKEAAACNIDTSLNIVRLANDCQRLRKMVLISTAYVHPHRSGLLKKELAPLPQPAAELYATIKGLTCKEPELMRSSRHPNTYSFTKSIAEHLICNFECSIPITILRPSIISAAWRHPFPGWIDSFAALGGFVALFGGGFLHVMEGELNTCFDIVPVDIVARDTIAYSELATFFTSSAQDGSFLSKQKVSIRHSVAGSSHSPSTSKMIEIGLAYFGKSAVFNRSPWLYMGPKNLWYHWCRAIHQTVPLDLASTWYYLVRNPGMTKKIGAIQRGIETMEKCFPYFCSHTYDFERGNRFDKGFTCEEYLRIICLGIDKHLLLGEREVVKNSDDEKVVIG